MHATNTTLRIPLPAEVMHAAWWLAGFLLLAALLAPAPARAGGLSLLPEPDIFAGAIAVTYDAGTDQFSASGVAAQIKTGGSTYAISPLAPGTFDISANIDAAGNLVGGALTILGEVAGLGFNSGTLLTGNLTDFQSGGVGDPFEFMFDVTGGDAAGLYGGPGGIMLSSSGFGGNFASDFSGTGNVADVGVTVSEPGALALLALAPLVMLRRRRQA